MLSGMLSTPGIYGVEAGMIGALAWIVWRSAKAADGEGPGAPEPAARPLPHP